ncbi:hypothetical protein JQC92_09605 [Shewanella sp. 202IG2-18]|uniref:hypothetical protein n=1 Tax=Parashewanella hymeniacidonis TaxID=2807618 RepID=UPI0019604439|nr:hypothetical protein [Parashewanella hymeniacidonis]MBM7072282.1 hypothetical protein [Parashewanella hymeniacidonis]
METARVAPPPLEAYKFYTEAESDSNPFPKSKVLTWNVMELYNYRNDTSLDTTSIKTYFQFIPPFSQRPLNSQFAVNRVDCYVRYKSNGSLEISEEPTFNTLLNNTLEQFPVSALVNFLSEKFKTHPCESVFTPSKTQPSSSAHDDSDSNEPLELEPFLFVEPLMVSGQSIHSLPSLSCQIKDLSARTQSGKDLFDAISREDASLVDTLLKNGTNYYFFEKGVSCMKKAIEVGNPLIISKLLLAGAALFIEGHKVSEDGCYLAAIFEINDEALNHLALDCVRIDSESTLNLYLDSLTHAQNFTPELFTKALSKCNFSDIEKDSYKEKLAITLRTVSEWNDSALFLAFIKICPDEFLMEFTTDKDEPFCEFAVKKYTIEQLKENLSQKMMSYIDQAQQDLEIQSRSNFNQVSSEYQTKTASVEEVELHELTQPS